MKALILNSGMGTRLGKITQNVPKCLTDINGETLLGRQLRILSKFKVTDIIITTGPFEDQIKHFVAKNFPSLDVHYINNPDYASTNYIYSMYVAKDFIIDDIIYMHGDMLFDEIVFKRLLETEHKDAALLDNVNFPPEKDFKGKIGKNGSIQEIGVNIFGYGCHFLAPVYKLSKEFMTAWMDEISIFIKSGSTKVYAENAFNSISSKLELKPVYFGDELCMEVDTIDDLKKAKEKLL